MERAVLGGSRQGVRQRTAQLHAVPEESELALHLYRQFAWGHQSLAQIRLTARLAKEELQLRGAAVPRHLSVLADLGGATDLTHNLWRDLERRVQQPFLRVSFEVLPLKPEPGAVPFFKPTETFEALRSKRPEAFRELVLPSTDKLAKFWRDVGQHPALRMHPVKKVPNYETRAVPLVLHGDGVPVTLIGASQKSCAFVSWRSLLCERAASRCQHQLICAVWTDMIITGRGGGSTVESLWAIVCDSFDRALDEASTHSRPFPLLVFASGDLEWFSLAHGLPRWNSLNPCGLCRVARQTMFHYKRVPTVPADTWHVPRDGCHVLRRKTLCPASVFPDLMHTKHLGVDQRICGSVVWLLIHQVMEGDVEANRRQLVTEIHAHRQQPSDRPVRRLTAGMYLGKTSDADCLQSYPCLRAKAAETRATLAALKDVWRERMDAGNELHVLTNIVLDLSNFIDTEVAASQEWHPTVEESAQLLTAAVTLTQCLTKLTKDYLRQGRHLFQLTFKSHWLIHCMQYSEFMNPKYLWTYSGEDYMSRCKTLLKSCLNGRKPLSALQRFGRQYSRAICVELDKESHRPVFL
ncbi:unnamed protein product [Symbiodinium natans]|uniref:Uncharacterized protein n=1 Tax=Symbiodinium natans TaxID=878477 RepID=A0A812K1F0_9DINO|nr:unnamed protein product [Symbiodinium natans]